MLKLQIYGGEHKNEVAVAWSIMLHYSENNYINIQGVLTSNVTIIIMLLRDALLPHRCSFESPNICLSSFIYNASYPQIHFFNSLLAHLLLCEQTVKCSTNKQSLFMSYDPKCGCLLMFFIGLIFSGAAIFQTSR